MKKDIQDLKNKRELIKKECELIKNDGRSKDIQILTLKKELQDLKNKGLSLFMPSKDEILKSLKSNEE